MLNKLLFFEAVGLALFGGLRPASALQDPATQYYDAFKGKTIAFVPITMASTIVQSWAAGLKRDLTPLGIKFVIRDGNFDTNASAQAITDLINQHVDVIIVQNNDLQAFTRLYRQAEKAGIYVVQIAMQSAVQTDAYVGADWTGLGEQMGQDAIESCTMPGKSGEIALVQGAMTSANGIFVTEGIKEAIANHPDIKIVANQGADWDPSKAFSIASAVLQQHPHLCAFLGYWDGQDQGIAAAVRQAGDTGKVLLMSSGAGEQKSCDAVKDGSFDIYYKYDSRTVVQQIVDTVSMLLQTHPKAGSMKVVQITPIIKLTKANVTPESCWSSADYIGDTLK